MKSKSKNLFNYIYIFFAIQLSGNMFFVAQNKQLNYIFFFILTLIIYLFFCKYRKIEREDFYFFIVILLCILGSYIFSPLEHISSYLHIILCLLCAYLFTRIYDIQTFCHYYVNILAFLAMISVVLFFFLLHNTALLNLFSQIPGSTMVVEEQGPRTYVNIFFVYTYMVTYGFGESYASAFDRNNGIFWEPGAYQFFLLLALILLNEFENNKERRLFLNIIFFITLATTGSTTGLITLIIIFIGYRKKILHFNNMPIKILFLLLITSILIYCIFTNYSFGLYNTILTAYNKIAGTTNYGSAFNRTGFESLGHIFDSFKTVIFGHGVTGMNSIDTTYHNTYLYYGLSIGLPFMICFVSKYYLRCKYIFKYSFCSWLCIMLSFSSESYALYIIPLSFLFFVKKASLMSNN